MKLLPLLLILFVFQLSNFAFAERPDVNVNVVNSPTVIVGNDSQSPIPVTVVNANTNSFEFLGFSDDQVHGGVGYGGTAATCQATFGAEARICKSTEVLDVASTILSANLRLRAWVQPVIVGIAGSNSPQLIDATGIRGSGTLTCTGWTTASSTQFGATVNSDFGFSSAQCDGLRRVACCR
jgi:hypothetical protein